MTHGRKLLMLPIWMARIAAPMMQWIARMHKKRPLFTSYYLHTPETGSVFSHEKATRELGFHPRSMDETERDTILWYSKPGVKMGAKLKRKLKAEGKVTLSLRRKAWSPAYLL